MIRHNVALLACIVVLSSGCATPSPSGKTGPLDYSRQIITTFYFVDAIDAEELVDVVRTVWDDGSVRAVAVPSRNAIVVSCQAKNTSIEINALMDGFKICEERDSQQSTGNDSE